MNSHSMYFFTLFFNLLNSELINTLIKDANFHQTTTAHTYNLVFQFGQVSPDGFLQEGILTNGQFPGPTLRLSQHEIFTVQVTNKLPHGLTIHFHGIHQSGTVSSDGVAGVTQYEIPPNGTYRYSMEVGKQSGTFMYHSHTGLDQNWAMGPIIIEDPPQLKSMESYKYDHEVTFLLSQCWHVPMSKIASGVLGAPFVDVPDTDSILINGRSHGNWSQEQGGDDVGYAVITVTPGATYRFRVIAPGVDSMLTFSVANHTRLRVIEMDSILVDPVTTDHLEINTAQRYSILVTMDQPVANYWITSTMIPGPGPGNGRAILHYAGAPYPDLAMRTQIFDQETKEVELDEWILPKLHPNQLVDQNIYPLPVTVDKEIVIRSQQVNVDGKTKFTINGQIFKDFHPPLLHQIRNGLNPWSPNSSHVHEIILGERIQIVFVNRMSDDGECEQHPWHMHGHTFYVVGQGADDYDPTGDRASIEANIARGGNQFRDVVTLFPNQTTGGNATGTPCGWTAIRFVADNPGVWLVHCHLTAHMLMGKLFILYEHSKQDNLLSQTI